MSRPRAPRPGLARSNSSPIGRTRRGVGTRHRRPVSANLHTSRSANMLARKGFLVILTLSAFLYIDSDMSDGPHRSLKMREGWKAFAGLADTPAFQRPEVTSALVEALSEDWHEEVAPEVLSGLRDTLADCRQVGMFGRDLGSRLEELKRVATGKPLALALIECADQVSAKGESGDDALERAARMALDLRVSRGIRQVEEHYLRKTDGLHASNVRDRCEHAADGTALDGLARSLTKIDSQAAPAKAPKKDGIDDGVPL